MKEGQSTDDDTRTVKAPSKHGRKLNKDKEALSIPEFKFDPIANSNMGLYSNLTKNVGQSFYSQEKLGRNQRFFFGKRKSIKSQTMSDNLSEKEADLSLNDAIQKLCSKST